MFIHPNAKCMYSGCYYHFAWLILSSFLFVTCEFSLVCATVSAPLWPLSWLLFLADALHTGWQCGLTLSDPQRLSTWPPSPVCRYPQSTAYLCGLLTHNFSVFLFCSSVLHLHPCRYCSFVPSPHPTSMQIHLLPAYSTVYVLGLSDWWSWLMQIQTIYKRRDSKPP